MFAVETLEGSFLHSQNGMTRNDMQACERVAARSNEVIIFRSTGPWSKRWLEADFPSKNFHVKGKSSDWGPHAGFVPYNGVYSKVGYDAAKAAKGTKANDDGIASHFAIKQALVLTGDQIDMQRDRDDAGKRALTAVHGIANGDRLLFAERSGDRRRFAFRAVVQGAAFEIRIYVDPVDMSVDALSAIVPETKLEVMASAEVGGQRPMTGDYDLMAVCPHWSDYGSLLSQEIYKPAIALAGVAPTTARERYIAAASGRAVVRHGHALPQDIRYRAGVGMDNVLDPSLHTMGSKGVNWETMNRESKRGHSFTKQDNPDRQEHGDMGNLTPRILRCINALNAEMGSTGARSALRRVHHNAESHRNRAFGGLTEGDMTEIKPGEAFGDGFPLTSFQPPAVTRGLRTTGNVVTIDNLADFRRYASGLDGLRYYVPKSWTWNM